MSASVKAAEPKNTKKYCVEYLTHSPLAKGFFVRFSKENYNAENVNFYLAVIQYQELYLGQEWLWDKAHITFESSKYDTIALWPSKRLTKETVDITIQRIYDQFLSVTAPEQICMSGGDKFRTIKKMALPSVYGPFVFEDALWEPIKSMNTYIIPQFLRSDLFEELRSLEDAIANPQTDPDTKGFPTIVFPSSDIGRITTPKLVWTDIYRNYDLYNKFSDFMVCQACDENLVCYQLIEAYNSCFTNNVLADDSEAKRIYKILLVSFIAKGSPYEISLRTSARDNMLLCAASPSVSIFDDAQSSVSEIIVSRFNEFLAEQFSTPESGSYEYEISCDYIRRVKMNRTATTQLIKRRDGRRDTPFPQAISADLSYLSNNKHASFFTFWKQKSKGTEGSKLLSGLGQSGQRDMMAKPDAGFPHSKTLPPGGIIINPPPGSDRTKQRRNSLSFIPNIGKF